MERKPRLAVPIKFKRLHTNAVIPKYETHGAACVDLIITEIDYQYENFVTVKFGFSSEIPEGYKVHLQPRSSFCQQGWIMQNSPGIIDSDYRGEWKTKFEAIPIGVKLNNYGDVQLFYADFPYKVGDRAIQASVEVNIHMNFREVEELTSTLRGEGSFGSTGK
jgi:dUTP pyrophosphatase